MSKKENITARLDKMNDEEKSLFLIEEAKKTEPNLEDIAILLEIGIPFQSVDGNSNTALHHAVKNKHADLVNLLLSSETIDIMYQENEKGLTPFFVAAVYSPEYIEAFVKAGINIHHSNALKMTALHYAVEANNVDALNRLISCGMDIDSGEGYFQTPLHLAVKSGNIQCTIALIDKGANPNAYSNDGYTPLHLAFAEGKLRETKMLIDANGDATLKTMNDGISCGHLAVKSVNIDFFTEYFKSLGIYSIPSVNGDFPIHYAIRLIKNEIAEALLKLGIESSITNEFNGFTALHYAAQLNNVFGVDTLLKNGSNTELKDTEGNTPLMIACKNKSELSLIRLMHSNADANCINNKGETLETVANSKLKKILKGFANHHDEKLKEKIRNDIRSMSKKEVKPGNRSKSGSSRKGNVQIPDATSQKKYLSALFKELKNPSIDDYELYLKRIENVNAVDEHGISIVEYLAQVGSGDDIEYCIKKGAKINIVNNDGRTLLMSAILEKNYSCIEVLLKYDYDIHQTDHFNNSLFVMAYWMELYELAMRFVNEGADTRNLISIPGRSF